MFIPHRVDSQYICFFLRQIFVESRITTFAPAFPRFLHLNNSLLSPSASATHSQPFAIWPVERGREEEAFVP